MQVLAFAVALAAAPLLSSSVRYPYLILALPLLLDPTIRSVRSQALVTAAIVTRVAAWLVIQAQVWPEPGRAFTLPIYGLLALLLIHGLVATWLERDSRLVPAVAACRREELTGTARGSAARVPAGAAAGGTTCRAAGRTTPWLVHETA
jgi:hypothetical protein